jgi:Trk K+ transport system NAD-binding subunit
MDHPIILCGLGRIGWRVLDSLRAAGLPVVAVDNRCSPNDPRLGQVRLVQGDCRQQEVLEEAGLLQASGVLIMTNDDLVNISTALMVRHRHATVRVVMRLFNQNLIARLGKAVTNIHALSTADLTAPLFALTALTGQALGTIQPAGVNDLPRQVAQATITSTSPLCGKTVADACNPCQMRAIAHLPAGGTPRFLRDVDEAATLIEGDRLILCGHPRDMAALLEDSSTALPHVRWAGWLRRFWRVAWRTLREVDLAVKVCTTVLVGVIVVSTIVFYFALDLKNPEHQRNRLSYAFFRTISVMATGGDMHDEQLRNWAWTYVAMLRLSGAALLAAFTAIATNYLLRAKLGGALEIRRIPDSGHVVVCGLGNIGFRVVEELINFGERVVVIEQVRDSRFVATARRLGVPVLIGDASVAEVLRQAHVPQARAVVAATSDDLINLEIALMVRELNPTKRVVVHLSDPTLAQTMREAANVRLALSIPSLAAPAFVAALFGDRVHAVFLIDGKMFAAVDLMIPPDDSFLAGRSARRLAADYGVLLIAVLDDKGRQILEPFDVCLKPGYRIMAISALADLERLMRREPAKKDCAVDVASFDPSTRSWVASFLQDRLGLSAEAANATINKPPFCVGTNLTRGEAEELLETFRKRDVVAKLRRGDGKG